jgi:hypothetical protein
MAQTRRDFLRKSVPAIAGGLTTLAVPGLTGCGVDIMPKNELGREELILHGNVQNILVDNARKSAIVQINSPIEKLGVDEIKHDNYLLQAKRPFWLSPRLANTDSTVDVYLSVSLRDLSPEIPLEIGNSIVFTLTEGYSEAVHYSSDNKGIVSQDTTYVVEGSPSRGRIISYEKHDQ